MAIVEQSEREIEGYITQLEKQIKEIPNAFKEMNNEEKAAGEESQPDSSAISGLNRST